MPNNNKKIWTNENQRGIVGLFLLLDASQINPLAQAEGFLSYKQSGGGCQHPLERLKKVQ